ncbi:D-glycero-D-manno-heptose 1,7-bisphosphate phosphatase [Parabacteroides sp. PFB2-12]|uniref:D-glycero-alpha-D-manno-heptose-1,7-bisphosphate 7-phosphatase n=1 Tax=unclassified Parabacteroides TaxID=2649774 RepID=UPI00247577D4|nr:MULTISPECIES: HAD family hydrolase [unclassified Parabacteroides]MDH6341532.1 D-glycero-D-manno-heptose 1,7-bisphosphate phosphatase [Parabacteroides sp. PM6-13]MDH6389326.1 D-glycero-D-manno-heptose 1,7-bisphosphate phosphatase [Parabacteroides sp. PFB2-12]
MGNTTRYSALFLDRDGVINQHRPNDYVKTIEEFIFTEGALEALRLLAPLFDYILIVTNQRGVGKGMMTPDALQEIHAYMLGEITAHGGRIDRIYTATAVSSEDPNRKPNPGMARQAKADFPAIDFANSLMVGDSLSDMQFASWAGIPAVLIGHKVSEKELSSLLLTAQYPDLFTFAKAIQ